MFLVSTNEPAFGVPGYDYTTMFNILDSNQDGSISMKEFQNGGLMPDEMDDDFRMLFDESDQNKNDKLELEGNHIKIRLWVGGWFVHTQNVATFLH